MISWDDLSKGAEWFGLENSRFSSLKPAFEATDKKLLAEAVAGIMDEVSAEKPLSISSPVCLRQFLLFCIVANYRKQQP